MSSTVDIGRVEAGRGLAWCPPALEAGQRGWGLSVQLWSLRSARNWGIGDFSDLASLATLAGGAGAAFVGINPTHARMLVPEVEASPYAPSSRCFLDVLMIDVEAIEGFASSQAVRRVVEADAFVRALSRARAATRLDYDQVASLKLAALEPLYRDFMAAGLACARHEGARAWHGFLDDQGVALQRFAHDEARRAPAGSLLAEPGFHAWMQWQASRQLQHAAAAARAAGMPVGLYRDLAVGSRRDGADAAVWPGLDAPGIRIGAPPDAFNANGQDWGLAAWSPQALADRRFGPFRTLVHENMRSAGLLRIDHAMALERLYWIGDGEPASAGGYVAQPFEPLAGIVCTESRRARCLVVAEDLGTVPAGFRDRLAALGWLSTRVLLLERDWAGGGQFIAPTQWPANSIGMLSSHDLPTLADWWQGSDLDRRERLGLALEPDARAVRSRDREALARLAQDFRWPAVCPPQHPLHHSATLVEALHGVLADSASVLVAVQLDDLLGEVEPVNMPGTHREYPNWRRRVATPLEALADDPRWHRLVCLMAARHWRREAVAA
jgi:4-alpha-glucanotransferase